MDKNVQDEIKNQIESNKVVLYMKGTRQNPMCGFSAKVVDILNSYGVDYSTVDVLSDQDIRQGIKEFSKWPTIPQLYINGKFIGGCDVCEEMHSNSELQPLLK